MSGKVAGESLRLFKPKCFEVWQSAVRLERLEAPSWCVSAELGLHPGRRPDVCAHAPHLLTRSSENLNQTKRMKDGLVRYSELLVLSPMTGE